MKTLKTKPVNYLTISYDIRDDKTESSTVIKYLEDELKAERLQGSVWYVRTELSQVAICNLLSINVLSAKERVLVTTAKDWAGWGNISDLPSIEHVCDPLE